MRATLSMIAVVLAAGAAAVLLNIVLLGNASSGDIPVGKLGPTAQMPTQQRLLPAPSGVIQPRTGTVRGEGRDD